MTVFLTPLQVSPAEGDLLIAAKIGGQLLAQKQATDVDVTINAPPNTTAESLI